MTIAEQILPCKVYIIGSMDVCFPLSSSKRAPGNGNQANVESHFSTLWIHHYKIFPFLFYLKMLENTDI